MIQYQAEPNQAQVAMHIPVLLSLETGFVEQIMQGLPVIGDLVTIMDVIIHGVVVSSQHEEAECSTPSEPRALPARQRIDFIMFQIGSRNFFMQPGFLLLLHVRSPPLPQVGRHGRHLYNQLLSNFETLLLLCRNSASTMQKLGFHGD